MHAITIQGWLHRALHMWLLIGVQLLYEKMQYALMNSLYHGTMKDLPQSRTCVLIVFVKEVLALIMSYA